MSKAAFILLASLAAVAANAQQISDRAALTSVIGGGTLDEFETYSISSGYYNASSLNVSTLDSTSVVNGQGPNLVHAGATYSNGGNLQWNSDGYFGMSTKSLSGTSSVLAIDYAAPVSAFGVDMKGYSGYSYSGKARIYNGTNLLDTLSFSVAGGTDGAFLGYQSLLGITRVELQDLDHSFSPVIDNHQYGTTQAVPEPTSMAALGLGALGVLKRRKRTAK